MAKKASKARKKKEQPELFYRTVTKEYWTGLDVNVGHTVAIEETADVRVGDLVAVVTLGDEDEWTMGVLQNITLSQIVLTFNSREKGIATFAEPIELRRILGRIVATYAYFVGSDLTM